MKIQHHDAATAAMQEAKQSTQNSLFVFINRRRFGSEHGIVDRMSGAAIAALMGVPAENAVVEIEQDDGRLSEIALDSSHAIVMGMHFLVTRQFVMGGSQTQCQQVPA
jgi:hypothetical protein